MKLLIIFNHPAPYKVDLFNDLSKNNKLDVIFEREKAKNRPKDFYNSDSYNFQRINMKGPKINIGKENCISGYIKKYVKTYYQKYDLIIFNGYSTFAEMKAIKFMQKNNIPYVLFINGGIIKNHELFFKKRLKEYYISNASFYLSPSKKSNEYLKHYGADEKKILNYPYSTMHTNEIQISPLTKKERNYIRDEYFLPKGDLYICPGQFIRRKNNLALIKLFRNKKQNLLLVGNGYLKNKYLRYIKRHKIKNVFVWDFLKKEKLMEIMKTCQGLISLSKKDIYGHTIVEAMACGIPVFSSKNIISAQEIIQNGCNGYILDKNKNLFFYINKSKEINRADIIKTAKKYTIENTAKIINKELMSLKCK